MTGQTKKWIAGAGGVIAAIMLATNPDQAAHLRAIKDRAALKPSQSLPVADFMAGMSYNNYFFFSTVTLARRVVSWGAFGKIYTTNWISDPFGIKS
jgi:hypothetical protein